jgi:hypothetical protein
MNRQLQAHRLPLLHGASGTANDASRQTNSSKEAVWRPAQRGGVHECPDPSPQRSLDVDRLAFVAGLVLMGGAATSVTSITTPGEEADTAGRCLRRMSWTRVWGELYANMTRCEAEISGPDTEALRGASPYTTRRRSSNASGRAMPSWTTTKSGHFYAYRPEKQSVRWSNSRERVPCPPLRAANRQHGQEAFNGTPYRAQDQLHLVRAGATTRTQWSCGSPRRSSR